MLILNQVFHLQGFIQEASCQIKQKKQLHKNFFHLIYQERNIEVLRMYKCRRHFSIKKHQNKIQIIQGHQRIIHDIENIKI